MEVSTAAQPSSGHKKRYVPIEAGTLGGCGLALIFGCLFYLFLLRPRRRYGHRGSLREMGPEPQTYRPRLQHSLLGGSNSQFLDWVPDLELDPGSGSPFNIDLETGNAWDWDSNLELSGLGELPFANVDLQTSFDLDHQNPDASTVQASSNLEPSCDKGFPLDIGLGIEHCVDRDSDVCLSGSRALPFVNPDLQTSLDFDHQDPNTFTVPANLDLGPSHGKDSFVGINNPNGASQQGMGSNPLRAPLTPTTIPSNDLPLSSLRTNSVLSISSSQSQAPPKPDSLPLPPAPTLRCPNCPRKFSSRVRLE